MGWRVDYTLSSSLLRTVEEPLVHLRLEVAAAPGGPVQPVAMSLSADKFKVLLAGEARLYREGKGRPEVLPNCCLPACLSPLQT